MSGAPGFSSECYRKESSGSILTKCTLTLLFDFSKSQNGPHLNQALKGFLQGWLQKGMFLCLYRLKVSLELLKALNESFTPCPQLFRYGSVIPEGAAVKLAEAVCSFLLLANASYQGHLLPALFFPVINNYLSLLPLMTSGRSSLMSLQQLKP